MPLIDLDLQNHLRDLPHDFSAIILSSLDGDVSTKRQTQPLILMGQGEAETTSVVSQDDFVNQLQGLPFVWVEEGLAHAIDNVLGYQIDHNSKQKQQQNMR